MIVQVYITPASRTVVVTISGFHQVTRAFFGELDPQGVRLEEGPRPSDRKLLGPRKEPP